MSCDDDCECQSILEPRLPKKAKLEEVYDVLLQAAGFVKQMGYILYRRDRLQRSVLDEHGLQKNFEGLANCLGMRVPDWDMLPLRTDRNISAEEQFQVVGEILYGNEDFTEKELDKHLCQLGSLVGYFSAEWDELNIQRKEK
jgi:hypothetical protein